MVTLAYFQSYIILNAIRLYIARLPFCNNFPHTVFPVDRLCPCDPTQRKWTQTGDCLLKKPRGRQTWVSLSFICTAERAQWPEGPLKAITRFGFVLQDLSQTPAREKLVFMSQATATPNRLLKTKLRSLKMMPKTSVNNLTSIRILSSFHGWSGYFVFCFTKCIQKGYTLNIRI